MGCSSRLLEPTLRMIRQAKKLFAAFIARRFAEVVGRALIAPKSCRLAAPKQLHEKGRGEDGLQQGAHGREAGADNGHIDLDAAPDVDAVKGPCRVLVGKEGGQKGLECLHVRSSSLIASRKTKRKMLATMTL